MSRYDYHWRPYVPVATRRRQARQKMEKLRKKGFDIQPVEIQGRKIARSFWGGGWCTHLEQFSDYANRLPRGRTYVRNGSVCHLEIARGRIKAMVSGSEIYNVIIEIKALPKKKWTDFKKQCTGRIGSLLELLQGKLSDGVMQVVTDRKRGLFPLPGEIGLNCDCPDWATMCKHVAAVLYGVGARLDERPELLFLLRGVDHEELITVETGEAAAAMGAGGGRRRIADADLQKTFGIDLDAAKAKKKKRGKKITGRSVPRPAGKARGRAKGKTLTLNRKPTSKAPRASSGSRPVSAGAVARLRAKFGMTRIQLSGLLGVSPATVGNWEKTRGRLRLQTRTLAAWKAVAGLGKKEAWKRLNN